MIINKLVGGSSPTYKVLITGLNENGERIQAIIEVGGNTPQEAIVTIAGYKPDLFTWSKPAHGERVYMDNVKIYSFEVIDNVK